MGSGKKLYTSRITLWDVETGKRIRHMEPSIDAVAVLSPDGKQVAVSHGNAVEVWKTGE